MYWGVCDKRTIEQYRENLSGVRIAVPRILETFKKFNIHATWATIGFLFFHDKKELLENVPSSIPTYENDAFSAYKHFPGINDDSAQFHFAPDLIDLICQYEGQEIGTHTFSHFYCLETGQTVEQFESDLKSAILAAQKLGLSIKSLVFPRNQWNAEYLNTLTKLGILCFRGNEPHWIYKASDNRNQNKIRRALRLLDSYLKISGHNTYDLQECFATKPFNLPSSTFLRSHSRRLAELEPIRLQRIKNQMTYAAKNKRLHHLWWHPHNFGVNTDQNILNLENLLYHYQCLNKKYQFASLNMKEVSDLAGSAHV